MLNFNTKVSTEDDEGPQAREISWHAELSPIHYCSGAGAPRHDQRRSFYVYTVVDSRYLEMDVAREREGSLNGSEVEGGAMRNGMCRKILRSGAALEAIVRRGSARSVRRCTV